MKRSPLKRGTSQLKRTPLRQVSKKRERINAQRRIVVAEVATRKPLCPWPGCRRLGEHPHEIWTRARSGQSDHALLCPQNIVMLCPEHHDDVHQHPSLGRKFNLIRWGYEGCPCGYPEKTGPTNTGRIEHL